MKMSQLIEESFAKKAQDQTTVEEGVADTVKVPSMMGLAAKDLIKHPNVGNGQNEGVVDQIKDAVAGAVDAHPAATGVAAGTALGAGALGAALAAKRYLAAKKAAKKA